MSRSVLCRTLYWALCWAAGLWLPAQAAPSAAGRWQGQAQIPGAPLSMVIDLQQQDGQLWLGSVILPGRGVKGAPLQQIRVDARGVEFSLAAAFGSAPSSTPTELELQWQPDGRLTGEFRQGGQRAPMSLQRQGEAQLDLPPQSTPPTPELQGVWRGRYELGGYARELTVTLAAQAQAGSWGQIVVVGKRRSELSISHVQQGRDFVTLWGAQGSVRIEGRWRASDGRIRGHWLQGPFEAELVLQKDPQVAP